MGKDKNVEDLIFKVKFNEREIDIRPGINENLEYSLRGYSGILAYQLNGLFHEVGLYRLMKVTEAKEFSLIITVKEDETSDVGYSNTFEYKFDE